MKKIIAFAVACVLLLSCAPLIFAADSKATSAADSLYELGLFSGTGTNADGTPIYDLDRAPTRAEAVTMLVRLLGKADEAKNGSYTTPFTDVPDWAKAYVGYAYENKLSFGTSDTTFGSSETVTPSQYITFVLRALGYESGTDFKWDAAWELSDKIGLTNGEYSASTKTFLRGSVAEISESALNVSLKADNSTTLLAELVADGAVDSSAAESYLSKPQTTPASTPTPTAATVKKGEQLKPQIGSILEKSDLSYDFGSELLQTADGTTFEAGTLTHSNGITKAAFSTDLVTKALGKGTYNASFLPSAGNTDGEIINGWFTKYLANFMFGDAAINGTRVFGAQQSQSDTYFVVIIYDQSHVIRAYCIMDCSSNETTLIMNKCNYNIQNLYDATTARINELRTRTGNISLTDTGEEIYSDGMDNGKPVKIYEGKYFSIDNMPSDAVGYSDGTWPDIASEHDTRLNYMLFRLWAGNMGVTDDPLSSNRFVPSYTKFEGQENFFYVFVLTDASGEPIAYVTKSV